MSTRVRPKTRAHIAGIKGDDGPDRDVIHGNLVIG
jgi:hypothetical protein